MANAIHPLSGADYILEQQLKAASEVAATDAVASAVLTADIPGEVTAAVAAAITTSGIPVVFIGDTDQTGVKVGDMWVKEDASIHIYDGTAWKQVVEAGS